MKKEYNNLDSFLDENYWKNHKILEDVYGFDKTLIKNIYCYLYPKDINEVFYFLTKKNDKYQHSYINNNNNNKCLICNEEQKNHINYNNSELNDEENNTKKAKDYIPEKYITGMIEPIPFNDVLRFKTKEKAMSKIIVNKDEMGSGFFCKINLKDTILKTFFTANHVLNKERIKKGSKIEIEHNGIKKYIVINDNRFVCTNEDLDYTCIQIFDDDNFDTFFEVDNKIDCDDPKKEYEFDKFVIIQFPKGKEISFCEGKIQNYHDHFIIHSISTNSGSSGSPIVLTTRNLTVIGIHIRKSVKENLNKGTYFKAIIKDIVQKIKNKKLIKYNNDNKYKSLPKNQINFESKKYDAFSKKEFEENNYNW